MTLFLDTSVIIAASHSSTGASRYIFDNAVRQGWVLVTAPFALNEVAQNLGRFPPEVASDWRQLKASLISVPDIPR